MKKKLICKNKYRSKKGMSLVEILVGVAIMVIVFASTLGAMVNGYTTTVYNSDKNKEDLLNSSVNEIIFNTFKCMQISRSDEATDVIQEIENVQSTGNVGGDDYATALVVAVKSKIDGAVFVPPSYSAGKFEPAFVDDAVFQYTIVPEVPSVVTTASGLAASDDVITGFRIITTFKTSGGNVTSESFVPYVGD